MSGPKHTPGPWAAEPDGAVVAQQRVPGWREVVADAYSCPVDAGNRAANARLIAAAPRLAEELRIIAEADPSKWDEDMRDQFREWAQNRARAALREAGIE